MGTWTRPNNRSSVVMRDGTSFNIGDLIGAGLDPFDNLSSRAVMDALARHNQAKNIFNLNPLFLGTRPEDTYQEEVVDLNADTTASNIPAFDTTLDDKIPKETIEPTSEPTPEQIYEENKKGTVFDLIDKYPTEDGGRYPVEFVVSILKNAANQGNANAAQILSNTPVAGPEGAFDGDGPAAGTGDPAASGAEGAGTPTGGTPQGQTGTPQGETSTPQGSTPTPQGGTPQGGTPTSDTPAVDSPIDTPTVSTGSVLDQTETGNVNVDDQPKGFLTGMTPQAQAIINEGNRSDITATMLGPLIAKQDVPIISPLQIKLDNVKQSPLSTALLFSNGLMGSFV